MHSKDKLGGHGGPQIVLEPVYHTQIENKHFNSNNHHEYDLYYVSMEPEKSIVYMDTIFHNRELTPESQEKLKQILSEAKYQLILKTIEVPHQHYVTREMDPARHTLTNTIYHLYNYQFYVDQWINYVPELKKQAIIVELDLIDLEVLSRCYKLYAYGHDPNSYRVPCRMRLAKYLGEKGLLSGWNEMDLSQSPTGLGWFVKVSGGTNKHDHPLAPVHTYNQLFEYLTTSRRLYNMYGVAQESQRKISVIFIPWNDQIATQPELEYRVIVYQGKLVAISQQACYQWFQKYQMAQCPDYQQIGHCIARQIQKYQFPFQSYVMDVWIEHKSHDDYECHVIEINPGYEFSGSGSALFHWITDEKVFRKNENMIYMRYVI